MNRNTIGTIILLIGIVLMIALSIKLTSFIAHSDLPLWAKLMILG